MRKTQRANAQVIWYDSRFLPQITPQVFDPQWQRSQGHLKGTAPGRGEAYFLRIMGHDLVHRPCRRGGLIGRFNTRLYLRLGARHSRAFREYRLLEWMHAQGLSVPRPVAARYAPFGLFYRADLITERIPGAQSLADTLRRTALTLEIWGQIGKHIRDMHELGIDHTDLNCRNILLDAQQKVWLIDFDKCRKRAAGGWRERNLARLRRSLDKEKLRQPGVSWSDADWSALLAGYENKDA